MDLRMDSRVVFSSYEQGMSLYGVLERTYCRDSIRENALGHNYILQPKHQERMLPQADEFSTVKVSGGKGEI